MKTVRGAELLVKTLESQGVEILFGIPGIHNLDIYDALLNSSIRHITARHEQGAGFMADGYARSSEKTGVALVITGPGLTNIMTPMAQAFHDSIPLVVLSSQLPSAFLGQRSGFLHELQNSTIMARSAAKESRCVTSAADIPRYIQDAFHLAHSGRPGPVHVEIPLDILRQELPMPSDKAAPISPHSLPVPEEGLMEAIRLLEQASRPVLILGGGACRTGSGIRDLVERLGAVVLETCAGKGTLDERHPLCLGARLHFADVREYILKADVVLALGTNFSPTDLWEMPFDCEGTLIQVNRDPADFLRNGRSGVEIVADVAELVPQLIQALNRPGPSLEAISQTVAALKQKTQQAAAAVTGMGDQYPFMLEMLSILRVELPEDAIVCFDMTGPAYVGLSEFPVYGPRSFLHPVGFGTLGHALPAAIGAKLANPERTVCAFSGDGGFQFTFPELAVACQERVALPIILWNNHGFGEIRRNEESRHPGQRIAVDLENPDFAALAKAYHIPGISVCTASNFRQALTQALPASHPVLIEIHAEGER